jgi:hypothetical protein
VVQRIDGGDDDHLRPPLAKHPVEFGGDITRRHGGAVLRGTPARQLDTPRIGVAQAHQLGPTRMRFLDPVLIEFVP